MSDTMHIAQFQSLATVGVHDWEQQIRQQCLIDIDYPVDAASAARTDTLAATCDYTALTEHITDYLSTQRFALLETLADRLAEHLLATFALDWVALRVSKISAINAAKHVSVRVERTKSAKKA